MTTRPPQKSEITEMAPTTSQVDRPRCASSRGIHDHHTRQKHLGQNELGMTSSHRAASPTTAAHDKPRHRGNSPSKSHGPPREPPRPAPLSYSRQRDRSRGRSREDYKRANPPAFGSPESSRPPHQTKRPRSRSLLTATASRPKKPRRARSPRRLDRATDRYHSPVPYYRSRSPGIPRGRSRSRSPAFRDHRPPPPRPRPPPPQRSGLRRSRSPPRTGPPHRDYNEPRRHSSPRRRDWPSSTPSGSGAPPLSDHAARRRASPGARGGNPHTALPASSPRDREGEREGEGRRAKKKSKNRRRDRERGARDVDHTSGATGANSIEVNMPNRGAYRGGFVSHMPPNVPRGPSEPRSFSHSSGRGTPNSFHGSPPPQSPFGGSHRSWGGSQQFSPHNHHLPQHNGFTSPTAPQSHFHASSPSYPPTGPAAHYSQNSFRGGPRGGAPMRGNTFSGGRGSHRGTFKNAQWTAQGPNRRSQNISAQNSNHSSPRPSEQGQCNEATTDNGENPFRPSKDLQVEDTGKSEKAAKDQMPPPSRPPPTGPQSQTPNKFSFSMKATSKPSMAGPRPEISSKFNAAPPRRDDTPQKPSPKAPQKAEKDRGGLPKNVPTEPASVRARAHDHRPTEAAKPESATRTRMVRKTMRRPKARPKLPPDLAKSKSVYFRKPGNESVVGSGTYGKVFKGLNVYTQKLVALKKIRMEGERDGFPVTAVREIKLLRSLKHKNVVELQEVMVEANECFMVFEYLSHDLTGLLNHPSYEVDLAVKKNLSQQLFEGLAYLHARGVLHRDIKAANILVSNEGLLKLADFGLARFYEKHHQLDYTNRVITIWYRSPELLLGETRYGPAVDIWSAACVMAEIFDKRALFPGDGSEINQLERIYGILGTPHRQDWPGLVDMPWFELLRPGYRRPSIFHEKYATRLPESAFALLENMLHYDPAKRPTAAQVLEHPYFSREEPAPRQATELKDIPGDWHEFEPKARKREIEKAKYRAAKEASAAAKEASAVGKETVNKKLDHDKEKDKEKKRPSESGESTREAKRLQVQARAERVRI